MHYRHIALQRTTNYLRLIRIYDWTYTDWQKPQAPLLCLLRPISALLPNKGVSSRFPVVEEGLPSSLKLSTEGLPTAL